MQKTDTIMLSPALLRAFIAVIETGSMSKAAKTLRCSQSTISRLIDQMEDETGLSLFERSFSSRRIELTEQGEAIEQRCRYALSTLEDLGTFCHGLSLDVEPEMRVVMPPIFDTNRTTTLIQSLTHTFPATRFSFHETSLFRVQEKIASGEVDFAINVFIASPEEGIRSIGLGSIECCFVCHPDHPLASQQPISASDLEFNTHLTYLMPQNAPPRPELNFSSKVVEAENTEQLMLLAKAGLGYALIPTLMLGKAKRQYGLTRLSSELDSRLSFPVHALFSQANQNRPVNSWLCQFLKSQPGWC